MTHLNISYVAKCIVCIIFLKVMATGRIGDHGTTVPLHVVSESRIDLDHAPIPHQRSQEMSVLEIATSLDHAMKCLAQVNNELFLSSLL